MNKNIEQNLQKLFNYVDNHPDVKVVYVNENSEYYPGPVHGAEPVSTDDIRATKAHYEALKAAQEATDLSSPAASRIESSFTEKVNEEKQDLSTGNTEESEPDPNALTAEEIAAISAQVQEEETTHATPAAPKSSAKSTKK